MRIGGDDGEKGNEGSTGERMTSESLYNMIVCIKKGRKRLHYLIKSDKMEVLKSLVTLQLNAEGNFYFVIKFFRNFENYFISLLRNRDESLCKEIIRKVW